jgi:hypothetical protein
MIDICLTFSSGRISICVWAAITHDYYTPLIFIRKCFPEERVRLCIESADLFMVFSKDIFSATYMEYIKRVCPHSVSRILSMHIPAPNPNLFASESIPTERTSNRDKLWMNTIQYATEILELHLVPHIYSLPGDPGDYQTVEDELQVYIAKLCQEYRKEYGAARMDWLPT